MVTVLFCFLDIWHICIILLTLFKAYILSVVFLFAVFACLSLQNDQFTPIIIYLNTLKCHFFAMYCAHM